ncbi:metallophosphoesterase [Candidatus Bathyarchaeota archaeon]|nr:metallophosphoesterase [Candidatus Bathyarchaeota archaeon]
MIKLKLITPFPALILEEGKEKTLVISDLHIGFEASLAKQGIHIPSQTSKMLKLMLKLIKISKPSSIIILGDLKHTIARVEVEERRDIPSFLNEVSMKVENIKLIPGNHDGGVKPLLPSSVEILPSSGFIAQENIALIHGHAWFSLKLLKCKGLIMGHMHPVVAFKDHFGFKSFKQVWVKASFNKINLINVLIKRFKSKLKEDLISSINLSQCLIMPSFNSLLGGQPVNLTWSREENVGKEYIGPLLRSSSINLMDAEVYLLDGSFLGKVSALQI